LRLKTLIYELVANVTPEEEISLKSLLESISQKYPDCSIEEKSVSTGPQPNNSNSFPPLDMSADFVGSEKTVK